MNYRPTATLHHAYALSDAQRMQPKINHAQMNDAADCVTGGPRNMGRRIGCGCGQQRMKDMELPDGSWLARCKCGRFGKGTTLATARAEMEGR